MNVPYSALWLQALTDLVRDAEQRARAAELRVTEAQAEVDHWRTVARQRRELLEAESEHVRLDPTTPTPADEEPVDHSEGATP